VGRAVSVSRREGARSASSLAVEGWGGILVVVCDEGLGWEVEVEVGIELVLRDLSGLKWSSV
jgi:hypothetical protein